MNKLKEHSVSKIALTFHCSNELFSITRTIFSHRRSEQLWKQNTNSEKNAIQVQYLEVSLIEYFFFCLKIKGLRGQLFE